MDRTILVCAFGLLAGMIAFIVYAVRRALADRTVETVEGDGTEWIAIETMGASEGSCF